MRKYVFINTFCLFFSITIFAQSISELKTDTLEIEAVDINSIPPLNVFIESSLKNSPLLSVSDQEVEKIMEEIEIKKSSWLDNLFVDGNVRYGLYNQVSITDMGASDIGVSSANEQLNYYGGVTLKLPLSHFLNNKKEIKILKYGIEQEKLKRNQLKKEITLLVIDEYYKLKSCEESMNVIQEVYQTYKINYLNSLDELEKGLMPISEFSTMIETYGKVKQSFVVSKNEYYAQYYKLQVLTGLNFQKLN